jgi:hypothetical protein
MYKNHVRIVKVLNNLISLHIKEMTTLYVNSLMQDLKSIRYLSQLLVISITNKGVN